MNWLKRLFGGAQAPPAEPAASSAVPAPNPQPSKIVIEVKRLILPDGVEAQIVEALQRDEGDPDEKWTRKGRRRIYGAFFHRVVGESFQNASGESRQAILAKAKVGRPVYFVPEPDNPHDPGAIRIYLDVGNGAGEQIGYLPRDNKLKPYVASGPIAAWLARVSPRDGVYGAVIYAVVKWEER